MSRQIMCLAATSLLAGSFMITACTDDPLDTGEPTAAVVAGAYRADADFGVYRLITINDGEVVDWLERGAEITIGLKADGTTEGHISIPGADEDGEDYVRDLAGTFTIQNGIVEFEHEADTFIRDMPFVWDNGALLGDREFGNDRRIILELVRQ